jgi:hypothetical protein
LKKKKTLEAYPALNIKTAEKTGISGISGISGIRGQARVLFPEERIRAYLISYKAQLLQTPTGLENTDSASSPPPSTLVEACRETRRTNQIQASRIRHKITTDRQLLTEAKIG